MAKNKSHSGTQKRGVDQTVQAPSITLETKFGTGAFVVREVTKAANSYFAPIRGIISAVRKETKAG